MENATSSWLESVLSASVRHTIFSVNSSVLLVLSLAGLPSNILNMAIFRKLGLDSSINISFFSLSAADFFCACIYAVLALIMMDMSGLIDIGVDLADIQFLLATVFVCISTFGSWVTTLISMERCYCVVAPVSVKQVCTRKSTIGLIVGMLLVQVAIIATNLYAVRIYMDRSPEGDRPRAVLDNAGTNGRLFVTLLFWGTSVPTLVCFGVIVLSTVFLAIALRQRSTWLQSLPGQRTGTIAVNRKLIMTVVAISVIYIACFVPSVAVGVLYFFIPALNPFQSEKRDLALAIGSFVRISQALSGVLNIFVYVRMNTRFRDCLKTLLCTLCAQLRVRVYQDERTS
ncbi:rhodopsin [Elysia marginata]|uniref:Rhodopsin n=1 Tax=Elysia marginata TaxID=1093978 RepID=A0AAV4JCC8_9GAST|nr:rhodopsin [Elysia marginata]